MKGIYYCLALIWFCSCNSPNDDILIFKKIVKNYNRKICKDSYAAKLNYKETATFNGKYVMYNSGYGFLLSLGYDYKIELDNFSFIFTNFRKSERQKEWLAYLENLYKDTPVKNQTDIAPGYNSAMSSFRGFEKCVLLNRDLSKIRIVGNGDGKENNKSIKFEYSFDNRTYSGKIIYDTITYKLLSIVLDRCVYYSEELRRFENAELFVKYLWLNSNLYINKIEVLFSNGSLKHEILIESQFYKRISLTRDECSQLTINDNNPLIHYSSNELLYHNDSINQKIINDLEIDSISLENQFRRNSNKGYYVATLKDGSSMTFSNQNSISSVLDKIVKQ